MYGKWAFPHSYDIYKLLHELAFEKILADPFFSYPKGHFIQFLPILG